MGDDDARLTLLERRALARMDAHTRALRARAAARESTRGMDTMRDTTSDAIAISRDIAALREAVTTLRELTHRVTERRMEALGLAITGQLDIIEELGDALADELDAANARAARWKRYGKAWEVHDHPRSTDELMGATAELETAWRDLRDHGDIVDLAAAPGETGGEQ